MSLLKNILLVVLVVTLCGPKICVAVCTVFSSSEVKELWDVCEKITDDEEKDETEKVSDVIEKDLAFPIIYSNSFNNLWKKVSHFIKHSSNPYFFYEEVFTPPPERV